MESNGDVARMKTRMAEDRAALQHTEHGGLDDLHTELDKSPVHEAAREGDADELERLIAADGQEQIHLRDKYGLTPLHWAAERGQVRFLRVLVAKGADVNAVEKRLFRRTPLHFAALSGSSEALEVLLEHGAKVNDAEYRGWTVVHYAAHAGNVEVLRVLVDAGVDLMAQTKAKQIALHVAAREGHSEMVAFLLSLMPSVDVSSLFDASGQTPVTLATAARHACVAHLLQAHTEPERGRDHSTTKSESTTTARAGLSTEDADGLKRKAPVC